MPLISHFSGFCPPFRWTLLSYLIHPVVREVHGGFDVTFLDAFFDNVQI